MRHLSEIKAANESACKPKPAVRTTTFKLKRGVGAQYDGYILAIGIPTTEAEHGIDPIISVRVACAKLAEGGGLSHVFKSWGPARTHQLGLRSETIERVLELTGVASNKLEKLFDDVFGKED